MHVRSGEGEEDQADSVRGGTGGHRRIIAVRELYHLILKGRSLVSLWHMSEDWNTTMPLLVCYGDISPGGGEKPSVLGKNWSIGSLGCFSDWDCISC